MTSNAHLIVSIYTGNRKNAGTDSTVHVIIHGDNETASKTILMNNLSNNFEQEKIDTFRLKEVENLDRFVEVERIELWKGKTYGLFADEWYVDKIVVENVATNAIFVFPVFRWIKPGYHYQFTHLDTSLPQFDKFQGQRKAEMVDKKKAYQYIIKVPNGPVQIKSLPTEEQFPFAYKWKIQINKLPLSCAMIWRKLLSNKTKWNSFDEIDVIFDGSLFKKPTMAARWDDDIEFGRQRLTGINPLIISLLRKVPEKFPVTDNLLGPLLEGLTICEAIEQRRLFLCDLKIVDKVPCTRNVLCAPFALFFVNKDQQLRPVAIQLFQEPGLDNPIFTPLDDPMLWKFVKMWYNHAEGTHHQAITHLGLTHLVMEGPAVAIQRNLSPSHPVFKILAPHLLYLIAVNSEGVPKLISEGGIVDQILSVGPKAYVTLLTRGVNEWRMDVHGLLPEDLKARGLDDPTVLPGYYYRDDGMMIFDAIKKYVTSYIDLYYTSQEMIKDDFEIQAWANEMVKERNQSCGGVGLKGVPGNGVIRSTEDLVSIITCIIFTCSVGHASANFGQYDIFAYPPYYPLWMTGKPPSSKQEKITEKDLLDSLPTYDVMQYLLVVASLLCIKATNCLGDFEVQYIFDPKARKLVDAFREDLKTINRNIRARNERLPVPYEYLLPEEIPNSISI